MGKLSEDMIRLSAEIQEQRAERQEYTRELKAEVAKLRETFRSEHASMSREARAQRQEVLRDLAAARRAWSGLSGTTPEAGKGLDEELQQVEAELEARRKKTNTRRSSGREKKKESGKNQTRSES